jgi:hypothetical protein
MWPSGWRVTEDGVRAWVGLGGSLSGVWKWSSHRCLQRLNQHLHQPAPPIPHALHLNCIDPTGQQQPSPATRRATTCRPPASASSRSPPPE